MALERGRSLGHYVIHNLLGAGGMGEVYVAEDTRLKRRIAIKVLPESLAQDKTRRLRFEREAQAVAALNHPNIVTLHSVEHAEATLFLTMELVEGQCLSDVIAARPMALAQFFAIAIPLADAIAVAHQRGITHRDLKPGNIMLTAEGRPKVLDFGLAKLVEVAPTEATAPGDTQSATGDGRIVGTTSYMSPEQAEGKTVDSRSDLFSLGIVLYEMLTGERPFKGDSSVSVLSSILKDTPRAIDDLNATVPRELSQIVRRCLVKDPDRRLQSAKDLRNELEEVKQSLESGELGAILPTAQSEIRSGSDQRASAVRSRARLWQAGIALVVLIAGGAVASRYWPAASPPVDDGTPAMSLTILTTQAGIEQHPSLSSDGPWMVYAADATGNLDIYLQGVGAQRPINLTADSPTDDDQPAFSPDGERIAFRSGRDGGGLFVMGRTGELVKKIIDRGFNPAWSPDGQRLAFSTSGVAENPGSRASTGELWSVTVATGDTSRLTANDAMQPAWSPDGSRIAYWGYPTQSRNREIWTVPANGGEPIRVTDHPAIDWNPVWSPDGRHLYFGSDRGGTLGLWRVRVDSQSGQATGSPEQIHLPAALAAHFSLSADGARLVFASYQLSQQVYAADFDARAGSIASPAPLTRGSRAWNYLDVSADGHRLVLSTQYPQEDIFGADANGDNLRQITNDAAHERGVRWAPDASRILYSSGNPGEFMHIFTMRPDGSDTRPVTTAFPASGVAWVAPQWAASGSRIAAFVIEDNGYLLDANAGGGRAVALPRVEPGHEAFRPGAWSPDERRIAGFTERTRQLVVYDVERRTYDQTGLQGFEADRGLQWFADGQRLLIARAGNIEVVNVAARKAATVVDPPARQSIIRFSLTSDNHRLFYILVANESDIALMTLK